MARLTRVFAQAIVLLGLAPIAYAVGLLAWQIVNWIHTGAWVGLPARLLVHASALAAPQFAAVAPFLPAGEWGWANQPQVLIMQSRVLGVVLDWVHIGVIAALIGWALIALGRSIAARQAEIIEWQDRQRSDRLRRAAQYRI